MAPVPGGILFITFHSSRRDDDTRLAEEIAREVSGVSRRYPCGLPFATGPSTIVIEAGEEPVDDDVVRKLADEVRELMHRLSDGYGIRDIRVATE